MTSEERENLQFMLNATELQLTWPYTEEEIKELKAQRDALILKLQEED